MQQGAVLAMLAKEPAHGYQLRARLREALGPVGEGMNDGQIYVTLTRLEKAGLATSEQSAGRRDRPDRKVYALTAAAAAGLADPVTIIDTQRRELLRRLRDAQRAAMAEPDRSPAALLLEGIVLRLQADLHWLEACEQNWTSQMEKYES